VVAACSGTVGLAAMVEQWYGARSSVKNGGDGYRRQRTSWTVGGQMLAAFLTGSGVLFLALQIMMIVWREPEISGLAGAMCSACVLAAGIVGHFYLTIAFGAAGLAILFFRWGGPRQRRRVRRVLGEKSRQLRDGLVRRMHQRRLARPGWSPSPSQ
jgi:hypothetical protein